MISRMSSEEVVMILVEKQNEDTYLVTVEEGRGKTKHTVTLDDAYYKNLAGAAESKEALIERSFRFLLKRESKESILSSFHLKVIARYFPEYEREIKKQ
jgi:hypothetical protein